MQAQVAFYTSRHKLFNRVVSWWLDGPSHCELVLFTDEQGISTCASSSFSDGGVRVKYMRLDPSHWELVPCDADLVFARGWLADHAGDGYDVLGLFGFIWRRVKGALRLWFCSEAVAAMLGFPESWRFDPATLAAVLRRKSNGN